MFDKIIRGEKRPIIVRKSQMCCESPKSRGNKRAFHLICKIHSSEFHISYSTKVFTNHDII